MTVVKRDFESELLHELKYFTHCKKKSKDKNHYCITTELARNLKMSPKKVGPTLKKLVDKGLIKQQDHTENHTKSKIFIPIDFQIEIIENQQRIIDSYLKSMKIFAKQMRDKPAYSNIKMTPLEQRGKAYFFDKDGMRHIENVGIVFNQNKIIQSRTFTCKFDKVGLRLMNQFCTHANECFDIVDSLTYSLDLGTLDEERYSKEVKKMRMELYHRISDLVNYSVNGSGINAREKAKIYRDIFIKVKTLFLIDQQQKISRFKI